MSFANNHPYLSDGILIVRYNGVGSQKSSRSFTQGSLSVRILERGKKLPKVNFDLRILTINFDCLKTITYHIHVYKTPAFYQNFGFPGWHTIQKLPFLTLRKCHYVRKDVYLSI